MPLNITTAAAKAKAKALRVRLAAMNIAITHQQALEVVAALEGEKSWGAASTGQPATLTRNETEAMLRYRAPPLAYAQLGRAPALAHVLRAYGQARGLERPQCDQFAEDYLRGLLDQVFGAQPACGLDQPDEAWLAALEKRLREQGTLENDLDELVYDVLGDRAASSVNNQGMAEQLRVLYARHAQRSGDVQRTRGALRAELEQHLAVALPAYESGHDWTAPSKDETDTDDVHATIRPFKRMLDAGFPPDGIRFFAEKHLKNLQALEPNARGKNAAIAATREFLASLPAAPAQD